MENPSNVLRLKLLAALSYISIATLGAIVSQPMFAAEVDPASQSTTSIPAIVSKSDTLLIARNPKIKRRHLRSAKQFRRANKRQKAPISQAIVQPNNDGTPPVPVIPQDRPSETTLSIPGNNTPLNQAPIPTTIEPTQRSTPRDNYAVNVESYYSSGLWLIIGCFVQFGLFVWSIVSTTSFMSEESAKKAIREERDRQG